MDEAIRLELQAEEPVFRAAPKVQKRIEWLLDKETLTHSEADELLIDEEVADYLSLLNRVVRNLHRPPFAAPFQKGGA